MEFEGAVLELPRAEVEQGSGGAVAYHYSETARDAQLSETDYSRSATGEARPSASGGRQHCFFQR